MMYYAFKFNFTIISDFLAWKKFSNMRMLNFCFSYVPVGSYRANSDISFQKRNETFIQLNFEKFSNKLVLLLEKILFCQCRIKTLLIICLL